MTRTPEGYQGITFSRSPLKRAKQRAKQKEKYIKTVNENPNLTKKQKRKLINDYTGFEGTKSMERLP